MPWDIKNAVLAHYCENDPYTLPRVSCLLTKQLLIPLHIIELIIDNEMVVFRRLECKYSGSENRNRNYVCFKKKTFLVI